MQLPRWLRWRSEREIEEELQAHLDEETQVHLDRGLIPNEARYAARRAVGNQTQLRERLREGDVIFQIEMLWRDVRFSTRRLLQAPLLSLGVIVTLTVGIGVNSTVFTVLNSLLLRPLVSKDPDSFAHVIATPLPYAKGKAQPGIGRRRLFSSAEYEALSRAGSFADVAVRSGPIGVANGYAFLVSCNYVSLYYDPPILGRGLQPEDCQPGASPVAIISDTYWRNYYNSSPDALGQTIAAGSERLVIAGVVPDALVLNDGNPSLMVPLTVQGILKDVQVPDRDTPWLELMARLKTGVSHKEAQAEVNVIAASLNIGARVTTGALVEDQWGSPGLNAVLAAISLIALACGLVYLLVCANVTTLLLSRAATRRQEMAVRASLGAGRGRLIRQLLTECILLALISGGASLWIAATLPSIVMNLESVGLTDVLKPDWRVFAFTFGLAVLAGCAAGLSPAFESLRFNLSASLRPLGRGGFGPGHSRIRTAIAATQLAVSTAAMIFAGLAFMASERAQYTGLGYDPKSVFIFSRFDGPGSEQSRRAIAEDMVVSLRSAPGIRAVTATPSIPFSLTDVQLKGGPVQRLAYRTATTSYFDVFQIRVLRGRLYTEDEAFKSLNPVPVVVSEALARQMWPDSEPVGQKLQIPGKDDAVVVGVVSNTSSLIPGELDEPLLYFPAQPQAAPNAIVFRVSGDPAAAVRAFRDRIRQIDARFDRTPQSVEWYISERMKQQRETAKLIALPAGAILLLALIGIYGVSSYSVTQRHHEISVRLALGARRTEIVSLFLRSLSRPLIMGLLGGAAITVIAGTFFKKAQPRSGFDALDPWAFAGGILVVVAAALLATYIPTRKASRMDPWRSLRDE